MTQSPASSHYSPPWTPTMRRIAALLAAAAIGLLLWRFQGLIGQVVAAAVLAYLLNPIIVWLNRRTPLSRGAASLLVYLLLLALLLAALALIGVAAYNQVRALIEGLPGLIDRALVLAARIDPQRPLVIGPLRIAPADLDWAAIERESLRLLDPALQQGPRAAGQVAQGTLSGIGWLALTFTISLYIAIDMPRLARSLAEAILESGYRDDFTRLSRELVQVGNAYLRGQAILGLAVGLVTGIGLGILGVRYALALGIMAGFLELVPYFGPILSAIVAVLVAFFQGANPLGLGQVEFALAALAVMVVVQQLEGSFLVPRVMGDALDMRPLTVILAVIIGGALAGFAGLVLAAPAAAALKLVGGYFWRKMLGLEPFPEDERASGGGRWRRGPSLLGRTLARLRRSDEDEG